MKSFILSLLIFTTALLTPTASFAAPKPMYNSVGEEIECIVRLKPDSNQKIWGTYSCDNCGIDASAKPIHDGAAECFGCGKTHGGEQIKAPTHFKRGGKIYFIAKASMVARMDGTEGLLLSCPFCGSHSNPRKNKSCTSCGAEYDRSQVSNAVARYKQNVTAPVVDPGGTIGSPGPANRSQLTGTTALGTVGEPGNFQAPKLDIPQPRPQQPAQGPQTTGVVLSEVNTESAIAKVPTPLKVGAVAAVAAGAIGFVVWGTDTYSDVGFVTYTDSNKVIVSMEDDNDYVLNVRGDEIVAWQVGEEVEIFFTNWGGPKGAERGNADVYAPVEEQ